MDSPYTPQVAEVVERIQESPNIRTLRLRFVDPRVHAAYTQLDAAVHPVPRREPRGLP